MEVLPKRKETLGNSLVVLRSEDGSWRPGMSPMRKWLFLSGAEDDTRRQVSSNTMFITHDIMKFADKWMEHKRSS